MNFSNILLRVIRTSQSLQHECKYVLTTYCQSEYMMQVKVKFIFFQVIFIQQLEFFCGFH